MTDPVGIPAEAASQDLYNMQVTDAVPLGFVEYLSPRAARGWCWMPARPSARISLEVRVNGAVIAVAVAGVYRPDLAESGIGDGCHGFAIDFADGQVGPSDIIQFRVPDSDIDLNIGPAARNWSPYEGAVEVLTNAQLRGWAWHPGWPNQAVRLEVYDKEALIEVTLADLYRPDLAQSGIGDGHHGFVVDLPAAESWDVSDIRVLVSGTDYAVPSLLPGTLEADKPAPSPASPFEALADFEHLMQVTDWFDAAFYLSRNPDIALEGKSPLVHYSTSGWKEGRSPTRWFSVIHYITAHEDVLLSPIEPFTHFLHVGRHEKRATEAALVVEEERAFRTSLARLQKLVDVEFYHVQNPAVVRSNVSAALHYLCCGWRNGRDPAPDFDVSYYLSAYPDILNAGIDPFLHYHDFGREEGRQPNANVRAAVLPHFDSAFYLTQSPTLDNLEPIEHFISFGWQQGLSPTPWFDTNFYLRLSPDVADAGLNPFRHFLECGKQERRPCFPKNLRRMPLDSHRPSILLVGHDALHSGAQIVLLEVVRWLANHTRYPLKVLLLGVGPLVADYAEYAEVLPLHRNVEDFLDDARLERFLRGSYSICYVNTVAASHFMTIYDHFQQFDKVRVVLHVHELEKVIIEFVERFSLIRKRASSFIAVSSSVGEVLQRVFHIPAELVFQSNAFITPRVIDWHDIAALRAASRSALGLDAKAFVVIGCGTVYPRKGPDLFINVAEILLASEPDIDIQFVWIGSGAELDSCRAAVETPALNGRVRFVGSMTDASELISAADVFCLSSREDPFPLVCLEAAQYGIPAVFFNESSGIREFVENDAGVPVACFQVVTMAHAIRAYLRSPILRERHGARARAKLMERFTSDQRVLEIFMHLREIAGLAPEVSVAVLTYNHGRFVKERLESVVGQSLRDIEILVLDDCSTDNTVGIARDFSHDVRIRIIENEANSGGPFPQWAKGIRQTTAGLIWIAEGDDFVGLDFLRELTPAFDDPLVNLAFCKTEVVDDFGIQQHNSLDGYFAHADFPHDVDSLKMDGAVAVNHGFGALCLIVNGSSAIMRRSGVKDALATAERFEMCGDWYFYLHALRRAKLFYSSRVVNYFRRHSESQVNNLEGTPTYFSEREVIAQFLLENFAISGKTAKMIIAHIDAEWYRFRNRGLPSDRTKLYRVGSEVASYLAGYRRKLRIGFYVHGMLFSKGGIERIAAQLANELAWRGHDVTIYCREWGESMPVYPLFEAVKVSAIFNEDNLEKSVPALRYSIARSDLDVFIPMLSEWLFTPIIEAALGLGVKVVASEHNDPWRIEELWWDRKNRLACFSRVDKIHMLLPRFLSSLPVKMRAKAVVIPNGIEIGVGDWESVGATLVIDRIIGVGRLEKQKRFDLLIKAFAKILDAADGWRLDIFGEGSERSSLQDIIDNAGVSTRVALCGNVDNVKAELHRSKIFVIPSAFEGFGIVIVEAQDASLPCVGFIDCNGPSDLIQHEKDGLLVERDEDGTSLANAIKRLIDNPAERALFGEAGRTASAAFNLNNVASQWEQHLYALCTDE